MVVSLSEAKRKFELLLTLVEGGETVTITRYGKPIADMVPSPVNEEVSQHKQPVRETP
jgi:prevent-host-death family protein